MNINNEIKATVLSFLTAGICLNAANQLTKIASNNNEVTKKQESVLNKNEYITLKPYTHYVKADIMANAPEWYTYFGDSEDGKYKYYINNSYVTVNINYDMLTSNFGIINDDIENTILDSNTNSGLKLGLK